MIPDIDPMLTMLPFRRSTMWAPTACDIRHSAVRFVSMTWSHSSSVTSRAGLWTQAPALLTRMSIWPARATAS